MGPRVNRRGHETTVSYYKVYVQKREHAAASISCFDQRQPRDYLRKGVSAAVYDKQSYGKLWEVVGALIGINVLPQKSTREAVAVRLFDSSLRLDRQTATCIVGGGWCDC